MIGPQTLLRAEMALAERRWEEAIERRARLLGDAPRAERTLSHTVASWLRAVAAGLIPLPSEPVCCPQLA